MDISDMKLEELVTKLCAVDAPAGFETPMAELAMKLLEPYMDEVKTDVMGNVLAVKYCGIPGAKRVCLTAHMDELGLIVTGAEDGALRFGTLGGADARMYTAREVKLLTSPEPVYGVIDAMPIHTQKGPDSDKAPELDKLFISTSLDLEKTPVPTGTPAVFVSPVMALGGGMLCGKALDDRACIAIILKALEELKGEDLAVDLCVLLTVQEELGMRGAVPGAYALEPDICLVLDVTSAATPDSGPELTVTLGGGAAVCLGPNIAVKLSDELIAIAEKDGIPYQLEVEEGNSGTDGWAVQVSRAGVLTALISLPLRYMHSPVETMKLADAEAVIRLVRAFVLEAGEAV